MPDKTETKTTTKVIRLEILKPENGDWKEVGKTLRDIQAATARALNACMRLYYVEALPRIETVRARGEKVTKKLIREGDETNLDKQAYATAKQICFPTASNLIYDTVSNIARQRWNNDWFDVLVRGDKSLPSYKNSCPISIRARGVELEEREETFTDKEGKVQSGKGRTIKLKLRPKVGSRIPVDSFILLNKSFDDSRTAIWSRLLTGEYKLGSVQILYSERKRKWFANISYTFPTPPFEGLDPNIRIGVDLGITVPLYLAVNNGFARAGLGEEGQSIRSFRIQLDRRRRALRQNERGILERREGHGRKHKIASIEKLRELEDNFRRTANHRLARGVVNFALKQRAGVIVMENLKGLHERATQDRIEEEDAGKNGNRFLEDWSYFELQNLIEQKAKEQGIEVERVNPYKTSQRCSKCGYIDRENRPATLDKNVKQSQFKCVKCDLKLNADYNAARNIATPDIEKKIELFMKNFGGKREGQVERQEAGARQLGLTVEP